MRTIRTISILVLCGVLAGCQTSKRFSWSPDRPSNDYAAIWQRQVSWPKLDQKPVYDFVKEIEAQANQKYDPDIAIRYPLFTNVVFNPGVTAETSVRISMDNGEMPLSELLSFLCLGQRKLFFSGTTAILAAENHGDGTGAIVLSGRCNDAATHEPIRKCTLSATRSVCSIDFAERGSDDYTVHPSRRGQYELSIPVAMYWAKYQVDDEHFSVAHAKPQALILTAAAEGYKSKEYVVLLDASNLTYELSVELTKKDSKNDL